MSKLGYSHVRRINEYIRGCICVLLLGRDIFETIDVVTQSKSTTLCLTWLVENDKILGQSQCLMH